MRISGAFLAVLVACLGGAPPALAQAVPGADAGAPQLAEGEALRAALERNRDIIASRLDVKAAEIDRVAALLYQNPQFEFTFGNIVVPPANPQGRMLKPGPFSQGIYTVGVSQVLDVWGKRGLRATAADRGIEEQRWRLADAIRQVTHAVRSAFADLVREQAEFGLARDTRTRYDETVRLSRARFAAGDISEAEFDKIELEGLKYRNDEIDAAMQLDLARSALAALLLADPGTLPRASETVVQRRPLAVADLVEQAEGARPDLKAARAALDKAKSALRAARREPWPDPSLGLSYTRDQFTVSGDNGNTFALSLGFGLPFFDRNQAGIAHADNDRQRAENEVARISHDLRVEVAEAVRKADRARDMLQVFEGGMLARADHSLKVAEKSFQIGAVSLLEFLEAERTYNETRAEYLRALDDYRHGLIDVAFTAGEPQ